MPETQKSDIAIPATTTEDIDDLLKGKFVVATTKVRDQF